MESRSHIWDSTIGCALTRKHVWLLEKEDERYSSREWDPFNTGDGNMSHPASKRPLLDFPSWLRHAGPPTLVFNSQSGPTVITQAIVPNNQNMVCKCSQHRSLTERRRWNASLRAQTLDAGLELRSVTCSNGSQQPRRRGTSWGRWATCRTQCVCRKCITCFV